MPTSTVPPAELAAFLEASHADPFHTLGMRRAGDLLAVRVFRPDAAEVTVIDTGNRARKFEAVKIHPEGFFEAVLPKGTAEFSYNLRRIPSAAFLGRRTSTCMPKATTGISTRNSARI